MRPLRFCHVTTFYPPHNFGGDGIGIERLCRALARRGHYVEVVYDRDAYRVLSHGRDPELAPDPDGIVRRALGSALPRASLLLTQQLGRPVLQRAALRRLLERGDWDVINFHNASLIGGPGVFAYGSALKLYMAHEHWLVCPTHVLYRYGREPCPARDCLRCTLSHERPPQLWRYTGFLEREARHIDRFVAMSRFSRDKHREYGFPFEMEVLPYFLPDPAAQSEPHERDASPHARPYFLFVGRLERIKGMQDLLPVFADYPDADLLVAGDGDYGATLRAQARDNPRVKFLGRVQGAELERLYAHAIALIVPSLCYETFGMIVIEAFRQRTPVIARRIGSLPEIIEAAHGGIVFSDERELSAALRRLQREPRLRAQFAENAYNAYARDYCERAVVPRYLAIIANAAARKGDRRLLAALSGE
jgi:glycosyltransferase involved in cell wall biosynthesis